MAIPHRAPGEGHLLVVNMPFQCSTHKCYPFRASAEETCSLLQRSTTDLLPQFRKPRVNFTAPVEPDEHMHEIKSSVSRDKV